MGRIGSFTAELRRRYERVPREPRAEPRKCDAVSLFEPLSSRKPAGQIFLFNSTARRHLILAQEEWNERAEHERT